MSVGCVMLVAQLASAAQGVEKRPLTVAASIETMRVMSARVDRVSSGGERKITQDILVSPDGRRFVVMLIRGDLARDGNWAELLVGSLESIEAAARLETVAKLFTRSLGATPITYAEWNRLTWLDNEHVAFFWEDEAHVRQAVAVDVSTAKVRYLTHHPTDVMTFDVSPGGTILFAAKAPPTTANRKQAIDHGFAVQNQDAYSLLRGEVDSTGVQSYETFVAHIHAKAPPRAIVLGGRAVTQGRPYVLKLSPDGRSAIIDGPTLEVPESWERYADPAVRRYAMEARRKRSGGRARQLQQLYVYDLASGASSPLWNAPKPLTSNTIAWSPDSRSVLLGPAFLPVDESDEAGLAGKAIAEVDIATGRFRQIRPRANTGGMFHVAGWMPSGIAILENGHRTVTYRRTGQGWQALASEQAPAAPAARLRIEVREDLVSPQRLFAVDEATGEERMILDLNPTLLRDFALGRVEMIEWADAEGRAWNGRLYYPTDYAAGRRYPLVLQPHGMAPATQFSLYGWGFPGGAPGLGPGISVYAAQPLANRGIAVLQVEDKFGAERIDFQGTPREAQVYSGAYEAAVAYLVARGITLRDKVGLSGWSRSGFHIEYALAHSTFPYAAAIVADNADASYVQGILGGVAAATSLDASYAGVNGAPGYGEGLKQWLQRAPGFNAERIRTPLRMQIESGGLPGVLRAWELFTVLRLLDRPVELYVVPDIERGNHVLQNPRQCLASQQGAVDWFDFWLNEREDPDPSKRPQYARWRELRALRTAARPGIAEPTH